MTARRLSSWTTRWAWIEIDGSLGAPFSSQSGQGVKTTWFSSFRVGERRTAVAAIRLAPSAVRVAKSTATPASRS